MTDARQFNWSVDRPVPLAALGSTLPVVPDPEIACHDVGEDCPVPSAARKFADKAAGFGWTVRITHARGPRTHSTTGAFLGMSDSIAVRLVRGHQHAYAAWIDGVFNGNTYPAMTWSPGRGLENLSAAEMAAALRPEQED